MQRLLNLLKQRSVIFFIAFLTLIAIITPISLYLLDARQEITITNSSQHYKVTYIPDKKFSDVLSEWGLGKPNKFRINAEKFTTVNSLNIIFTDKTQTLIRQLDKNGQSIIWSSDSKIEGNKLVIYININPSIFTQDLYLNNNNRNIDKEITLIVLKTIYAKTHLPEVSQKNQNDLQKAKEQLVLNTNNVPFKTELTN